MITVMWLTCFRQGASNVANASLTCISGVELEGIRQRQRERDPFGTEIEISTPWEQELIISIRVLESETHVVIEHNCCFKRIMRQCTWSLTQKDDVSTHLDPTHFVLRACNLLQDRWELVPVPRKRNLLGRKLTRPLQSKTVKTFGSNPPP